MNTSNDTNQIIVMIIAIIYCIGGIYGVWMGLLGITNSNMKIPGLYQFGILISNLVNGKVKTAQFEKDMDDPKKKMKTGIMFLCFSILFFGLSIFLIFWA
jgi:hypothetical protein